MGKIVYNKLFDKLKEKEISTYKLRKDKIISESTLQNLREGKPIRTDSIANLCEVLRCQPGDLLQYIPDQK